MIELCAACDCPSMALIDSTYLPYQGEPINCLLCAVCVTQMQAGDVRLKQLLELRLLARVACA